MEEKTSLPRNFDLASFQRAKERMIATNDAAYTPFYQRGRVDKIKNYTEKEIQDIIESGSLAEQQKLSRNYFYKDGFYKKINIDYATLLDYAGFLIPNALYGKYLSNSNI